MQLTEQQQQTVKQWAKEGCGLSEIQRRLTSEFALAMTYMDVRLLAIELGLSLQEKPEPKARVVAPPAKPGGRAADEALPSLEDDAGGDEGGAPRLNVQVDRVTKPGSLASGSVVFSDGVSATWSVDQFGRLALAASKPWYRPSQEDVVAFQTELQDALARRGF